MNVALLLALLFTGVLVMGGIAVSLSSKNLLKQRVENKRLEGNAAGGPRVVIVVASILGFFIARLWFEEMAPSNLRQLSGMPGGGTTFGVLVALFVFALGSFVAGRQKR